MKTARYFAAIGAIIGWFAILSQLVITISGRSVSLAEQLFRFIGYFTITTNILVALCFTSYWLWASDRSTGSRKGPLLSSSGTIFSVTVFISMVAILYNVILRPLGVPSGFPLLVNELLHVVQPLLFMLFWICFIRKDELTWKAFFPWLVYPVAYILYVVVLGGLTGHYPYPFADVGKLGYPRALLNGLLILGALMLFALLLLWLVRLGKKHIIPPGK